MHNRNPLTASIGTAMLVIVLFAAFLGFSTSGTINRIDAVDSTDVPLVQAAWEIRYLDEVLTQSAARFVTASPAEAPAWEERYLAAADQLDAVIGFALEEASPSETAFITDLDAANTRLIELETEMFDLTKAGNPEAAQAILEGEYEDLKVDYAVGLDGFFDAQQQRIDDGLSEAKGAANAARVIVIALAVVTIFLLWRIHNTLGKFLAGRPIRQAETMSKSERMAA